MSTFFLLDPFVSSNPVLDVTHSDVGVADATGVLVLKVPSGVGIYGQPKNLSQLVSAKSSGLLARYAGFTHCLHDPCLSPDRVDVGGSSRVMLAIASTNHCIISNGGYISTPRMTLDVAPSTYAVVWDAYTIATSDPLSGRTTRMYQERDPSVLSCTVTWDETTPVIATVGSGMTQPYSAAVPIVKLRFSSVTTERIFLGSWAILYRA